MTLVKARGKARSLEVPCRLLGYTRQAYYQRERREERDSMVAELVVQEVIRLRRVQKRIGVRKLYHMLQGFLREHGIEIGRDSLFDILREHGLLVRRRRTKRPRTTFSLPWRRYKNLIRDIVPTHSNHVWVSDITYLRIKEGFAYLSLITDAYSRKIVGYHLSRSLSADGPVSALKTALRNNPDRRGLIHHSDRGLQYHSSAYVQLLKGIEISMTEKSDPLENAIAERVNGILKDELLEKQFKSFTEAQARLVQAVNTYNYLRPHMSVDMLTPVEAHTRSGELKRRWKNYFSTSPMLRPRPEHWRKTKLKKEAM